MLGGAGRSPGAHPDVVSEASLVTCIPAVKQYLLQFAGVEKQACVEQSLSSGAIGPYHWGTRFYLPWGAVEVVGRGEVGFCSFDRRPGWAGLLAKGT